MQNRRTDTEGVERQAERVGARAALPSPDHLDARAGGHGAPGRHRRGRRRNVQDHRPAWREQDTQRRRHAESAAEGGMRGVAPRAALIWQEQRRLYHP